MDPRRLALVVVRHWVIVLVAVVTMVVLSVGVTYLITPSYRSTARLFISTTSGSDNLQLYQGGNFTADRVQSYAELISSPSVLDPVVAALDLPISSGELADHLTAAATSGTVVLEVRAEDSTGTGAAAIAGAAANSLRTQIELLETPSRGGPPPVKVTVLPQGPPPEVPVWPNPEMNVVIGLLAGLILGLGAALLRDKVSDVISDENDLRGITAVPVLSTIVFDPGAGDEPIARRDPHGPRAEGFRHLRTNLQFAAVDIAPLVVTVTSALPGEGKSSTAGNLAWSLQQLGLRVCLVDGDLRRPSLAAFFGLVSEVGLTTVLVGRARLDDVVQSTRGGPDVLPAGDIPPNPSELLSSRSMAALLAQVAERYDAVIIDAPPTIPVADAAVLASLASATLMVVHTGRTSRRQLEHGLRNLQQAGTPIVGLVLNMTGGASRAGYYYSDGKVSTYRPAGGVPVPDDGPPPAPVPSPVPTGREVLRLDTTAGNGRPRHGADPTPAGEAGTR